MSSRGLGIPILWVFLWLLLSSPILAAEPKSGLAHASFRSLKLEESIPGAPIHTLKQDRNGQLWAGTGDGLACFTGVAWKHIPIGPGHSYSIRSLLETSDGSLWVGSERNGLWRLKEDTWSRFSDLTGVRLPSERIQALLESRNREGKPILWIGTERGLGFWEEGRWCLQGSAEGLPDLMIWKLREVREPNGQVRIWAATAKGTVRLTDRGWEAIGPGQHPGSMDIHTNDVLSVEREAGRWEVWVSIWNQGLARWDGTTWTSFGPKEGFPSRHPTGLHVARDAQGKSLLWASTYDAGVAWFDGTWHTIGAREGFPSLNVLALESVPGGKPSILVGTRNAGIQAIDLGGWAPFGSHQGLPSDLVTCFAEEKRPGKETLFWIGTTQGLVRWEESSGQLVTYFKELPSTYIQSILPSQDEAGRRILWVGTLRGLMRFDGQQWKLLGRQEGFPEGSTSPMMETQDKQGKRTLWVGLSRGLAWRQDGKWHFETSKEAFPRSAILGLKSTMDPDGELSLWAATRSEGIRRLRKGQWSSFGLAEGLPTLQLMSLMKMQDVRGRAWLWAGTADGRVAYYCPERPHSRWTTLPPAQLLLLAGSPIRGLITDSAGRVYAGSQRGIVRLTLESTEDGFRIARLDSFTTGDGLPNQACYGGMRDSKGRIWVGTPHGASVFDPARESPAPPLGSPRFFRVERVDGLRSVKPGESLRYDENHLLFEFALPVHQRFEDTQFRTELLGIDKTGPWRKASFRELSGLGSGAYTLRLWARNYAGAESGPTDFHFRIRPAPWKSLWALGVYSLFLLGLVVLAIHLRTRMLRQRARQLEATVASALAEVKTLQGFLPICAYCKKIRDDSGYWEQLENYLGKHSGASFSHGVCPDCARHLKEELENLKAKSGSNEFE